MDAGDGRGRQRTRRRQRTLRYLQEVRMGGSRHGERSLKGGSKLLMIGNYDLQERYGIWYRLPRTTDISTCYRHLLAVMRLSNNVAHSPGS